MSSAGHDDPGEPTVGDVPSRIHRALERGASVGRYLVVEQLGAGGMGVVYKAFDPDLGRAVALKLLHTQKRAADVHRERLLREAQALARLSHPNVVAVHDVGTFEGDVFVAMELVDGRTLPAWLAEARPSQREILDVFCDAGAGLAAAHRASLVHRDVKPDNLIVGKDGRVRVIDFGLARDAHALAEPDGGGGGGGGGGAHPSARAPVADELDSHDRLRSSLTRDGFVVGTPRFMAPEQHRGGVASERTDQFSFCVSLYLALYGELPYDDGGSVSDYARSVSLGRIREPPRASRVPRWLRAVVVRGLSPSPEDRWPSMEALLGELRRDRRRATRRALATVAAVAAVALVMAVAVRVQRAQRLVCAGAASRLAGAWDADVRARMHAAFAATNRPYAAHAFERASAMLDGYAAAWTAMRTSACEATRVHGEQSEELLDLRMECLDQRGRELGALTELFTAADATLVERATNAVAALTPIDGCANASLLKAPTRLPRDAATLARVDALRERLARGQALAQAMRDKDGLALMKPVADEAHAIGHQPTEAQALNLLGLFQWRTGDPKRARATLQRALLAAEGGKDDAAAAIACIRLVRAIGDEEPRSPDAMLWGEHAAQWVSRVGGAMPKLEIDLQNVLAVIASGRGEFDAARQHDETRLQLATRAFGAESVEVAQAVGDLAVDVYELGDLAGSLRNSERAVDIELKTLGPDHPSLGQHLINVSAVEIQLGRLDEALIAAQRAEAILRPISLPSDPWVGMAEVNLGEILQLQGHDDEALRVWQRALPTQSDPDVAASLHANIGSVLNDRHRWAEALAMHEKALAIVEKAFGVDHPSNGPPLNGIGVAELGLGHVARAVAVLERAHRLAHVQPRQRGRIALALAKALEAAGNDARVRALMDDARADLAKAAASNRRELDEIDAWRQRHR